jgi:hypothetical protein
MPCHYQRCMTDSKCRWTKWNPSNNYVTTGGQQQRENTPQCLKLMTTLWVTSAVERCVQDSAARNST